MLIWKRKTGGQTKNGLQRIFLPKASQNDKKYQSKPADFIKP
jgi:hypothetical protein